MKTIAVLNFKGGVGKTVTTATLAYLLAKQGKRILLIDGDSQGNLSMSFGIDAEEGADTLALLTEGAGYYPEFVTPTIFDGIDLIPSDINLLVADRHMAQSGVGRMQRAIADLRDAIEEDADQDNAYDLILIDCPPALSAACTAALAAAAGKGCVVRAFARRRVWRTRIYGRSRCARCPASCCGSRRAGSC